MGTKNAPGLFDCHANAEPDEPMFVLLGRDKHAPLLVNLWATLRRLEGEDPAKVDEAVKCANDMVTWLGQVKPGTVPAGMRGGARALAMLADEVGAVVTIDQVPLPPLAMGHYRHVATVRARRGRSE